jgi:hypothetical protein
VTPFTFSVSLPADRWYLPAVHDLAVRVARYAGFADADAERVAALVQHMAGPSLGDVRGGEVSLRFEGRDDGLHVEIAASELGAVPASPANVQEITRHREGGRDVCRLLCKVKV